MRQTEQKQNLNVQNKVNFNARDAIKKIMTDEKLKSEFLWSFGRKEKKMPRGFEEFVSSSQCEEFLESIFDYCTYLFHVEDKKAELEAEAKL